jgi:hypothetical protein
MLSDCFQLCITTFAPQKSGVFQELGTTSIDVRQNALKQLRAVSIGLLLLQSALLQLMQH